MAKIRTGSVGYNPLSWMRIGCAWVTYEEAKSTFPAGWTQLGSRMLEQQSFESQQPSFCCNSSLVISLHVDHMWLHFNMSYITLTITGIDSKVCVCLLSATVHKW